MKYDKQIMNSFELVPVAESMPFCAQIDCPYCEDESEEFWDEDSNGDGGLELIVEQLQEMGLPVDAYLNILCCVGAEGWHCPNCDWQHVVTYYVNIQMDFGKQFKWVEGTRYETPFEQYARKQRNYLNRQREAGQLSMFE